ncbi:MAG TPA: poly-beta-1,6-N-acetyl-D-glucosamine biosynthesis protein PgaD [Fluviicoccus sp.]|nr:poly-beta-1,6-N-acetyl-D-glucosamine biosynthesis protein PgaD [Fluviicoccus sp.]
MNLTDSLIINAPHRLGLPRRVLTWALTLGLWILWGCLWEPIIHNYSYLVHCCGSYSVAAARLLGGAPVISAEHISAALLGTAATLMLWGLLPSQRQTEPHRRNGTDDYARHFGLSEVDILRGRGASVCTVHHDEHGRITAIVTHPAD